MAITFQDQKELDQAFAQYGKTYGGVKQDYFAPLFLKRKFGCAIEDIAHQVAFGGNDFGIDAFYVDHAARNLYLYQFKWSESPGLFKGSFKRLIDAGIEYIFDSSKQHHVHSNLLDQLKATLHETQAMIERVFICFVFKGKSEDAEKSKVLNYLREELENRKFFIDKFFDHPVDLTVQFIAGPISGKPITYPTEYTIHLEESLSAQTPTGETLHIGLVPLMELHSIYAAMKQRFLDHNIRAGLSPDRAPNKKIREALMQILKGQEAPEEFLFDHNGMTLAVESLKPLDGQLILTAPRLLNGAQTITSLDKFLQDNAKNALLKQKEAVLRSVRVLVKIVSPSSHKGFITNVTISNNRQNPVEPWHLRASDLIQLELEEKFREDLGIFYERQEGSFDNMSDSDLAELGIYQYRAIEIKRLAQTFLASQGEIYKMTDLPDVFEDEKIYRSTFRDAVLSRDSKRILLAYKIQFPLNRIIREIAEKYPNTCDYFRYARNLIWALLIQALLNESDLDYYANQYGSSLSVEFNYTDRLRKLLNTRVRPVLVEVGNRKDNQSKIKNEKYSFLRNNVMFDDCMDVATKKYDWSKRWL